MLGIYVVLFIIAIFSLAGCSKYRSQSYNSPKNTKIDVSVKSYDDMDSLDSEMQDFHEVEVPSVKIYHVTFST